MRLCAAGFTSSQRNPRYCETVVGRSILTSGSRSFRNQFQGAPLGGAGGLEGLAKYGKSRRYEQAKTPAPPKYKTCIKFAAQGGAGVFACANFASPSKKPHQVDRNCGRCAPTDFR